MAMTPEGRVKKLITKILKFYDAYYFMPVQAGYGTMGLDYHCCSEGRALFIEAKSETGKLSPRQIRLIQRIRASGGVVFVIFGTDPPQYYPLINFLDMGENKQLLCITEVFKVSNPKDFASE